MLPHEQSRSRTCYRDRRSNTLVLARRESLPEAVRATQASVGDRVAPICITRLDLRRVLKKAKSGRKKRSVTGKRVTGPDVRRMIVQERRPILPTWLVARELVSCISEWCACIHEYRVSIIHPGYAQPLRVDSSLPSRLLKATVSGATFGV